MNGGFCESEREIELQTAEVEGQIRKNELRTEEVEDKKMKNELRLAEK